MIETVHSKMTLNTDIYKLMTLDDLCPRFKVTTHYGNRLLVSGQRFCGLPFCFDTTACNGIAGLFTARLNEIVPVRYAVHQGVNIVR